MSLDNIFNLGSVFAVIVSAAAIVLTTRKRARQPVNYNNLSAREQRLEQRVADLERQAEQDRGRAEQDRLERQRLENTVTILQSMLYEKQTEIDNLRRDLETARRRLAVLEVASKQPAVQRVPGSEQPILLAVVGNDPALTVDLAALREVERSGNFRLSRLDGSTKADLKRTLDRYRSNRRPIRYVHMAVHAGPGGMMLAGELVTGAWLSENLKNVEVLVINGCQSADIGDQIGIVPAVVTMREDLAHEDAAQFARLFWTGIGEGMAPAAAFEDALRLSPQGVAEFAEMA